MPADEPTRQPAPGTPPGPLLGDVLVNLRFCDRDTIEAIVREARAAGRPMGQLLLEQGLIDSEQLAIAIAERFGLQYASLRTLVPDLAAMRLVSPETQHRLQAVPLRFRDAKTLLVAMADPSNVVAIDDLAMLTDLRVQPVVVSPEDLDVLLGRVNRLEEEFIEEEVTEADEELAAVDAALEAAADDGPSVKLVRSIVSQAIEQGASDVHVDPDRGDLQVRFRIDGMITEAARISGRQSAQVISRIKIISGLDVFERRLPQNGRTSVTIDGRRVDIRVTTVPLVDGECAVLRLLDPGHRLLSFTELGMSDSDRARVEGALARAQGAILATGPTGSGKSTSLYAAIAIANSPSKTVMTIEDPIEFRLAGVKQMQVAERVGLSLEAGLRAVVRADPDIIMLDEMRDLESSKIAIDAALRGRLVLSTLHTNSASAAAGRLVDMGIEPYLAASAITCVFAQRLARRLCRHCRRPLQVAAADVGLPNGGEVEIFEPRGCGHCGHTGYRWRVGLFEVMAISEEIRGLIVARATAGEIERMAIAQGMRTLAEDGMDKVRAGETTLAEVARVTA